MIRPDDPRHGTTNAYCNLRCRCDRCRAANAARRREYRRTRRDVRVDERAANAARHRALTRLAQRYHEEYVSLVNEERAAAGLPALGEVPPGPKP